MPKPPKWQDTIEDIEWLITCGETHPETIARRLGYSNPQSLYRALYRARRPDLAAKITPKHVSQPPSTLNTMGHTPTNP